MSRTVEHICVVKRAMLGMRENVRQAHSEDLRSLNYQTQRVEHITSNPNIDGLFVFEIYVIYIYVIYIRNIRNIRT